MAKDTFLFDKLLPELDKGNINFWNQMTDEQKKSVNFVVLKFMSSIKGKPSDQEIQLLAVNYFANRNFFDFAKHPQLQYQLMACCGSGKEKFHSWVGKRNKNKNKNIINEFDKLVEKVFPFEKKADLELLKKINNKEYWMEVFADTGMQIDELKKVEKVVSDYYA